MRYIFCGDVHGKVEVVREVLDRVEHSESPTTAIFVGDIIDSYDRSLEDHEECYKLILRAIRNGKARAIFGNHELSYLMPKPHRCSGYTYDHSVLIRKYEDQIRKLFEPFIWLEDSVLVTHAGLTKELYDELKITDQKDIPETLKWAAMNEKSPVHNIGRCRGGHADYGGIYWCDWNHEFCAVDGLIQVFGHTRGEGIRSSEYGPSYCIDCLDKMPADQLEFLEMEFKEDEATDSGRGNDDIPEGESLC